MKEQTTFRFSRSMRLISLIAFVPILGVLAWGSVVMLRIAPELDLTTWTLIFLGVAIPLYLGLIGYMYAFYTRFRIDVDDGVIRLTTIRLPMTRPFSCAYEDVVQVRRGFARGMIEVVPRDGRPLQVNVTAIEGRGRGLLQALRARLGEERVPSDIEETLLQWTRFDRSVLVYLAAYIALLILLLANLVGDELLLDRIAWSTAWAAERYEYESVAALSLDDAGTPWLVTRTYDDDVRYSRLRHVSGRSDGTSPQKSSTESQPGSDGTSAWPRMATGSRWSSAGNNCSAGRARIGSRSPFRRRTSRSRSLPGTRW